MTVTKQLSVSGISNAESYLNKILKGYELKEVCCFNNDATKLILTRPDENEPHMHRRVIAKQFSKRKYESAKDGINKFSQTKKMGLIAFHNWKSVLEIEREKDWLVIFTEII